LYQRAQLSINNDHEHHRLKTQQLVLDLWFRVMFDFCLKIKVLKTVFWTYHRVEEIKRSTLMKTVQNSNMRHGRTGKHMLIMSLLYLDRLTWSKYQTTLHTWLTRIKITSSWCNHSVSVYSWHSMSVTSKLMYCFYSNQHSVSHHPRQIWNILFLFLPVGSILARQWKCGRRTPPITRVFQINYCIINLLWIKKLKKKSKVLFSLKIKILTIFKR